MQRICRVWILCLCAGKALLPWTSSPEEAYAETLRLNHQYAMDGCDPCSYAGIGWCALRSARSHPSEQPDCSGSRPWGRSVVLSV